MHLEPLVPWALLVVLIVPLLAFCVWQAFANRATPRSTGGSLHWTIRAVAVLALAVIGAGPARSEASSQEVGVGVDVFLVVDRTGSMVAEDYVDGTPRLDGVRADLPGLVQAVPGARYSIVSWDSTASRQLPLSSDGQAVASWADTLRQEPTGQSTGSNVGRPVEVLAEALENAAEAQPSHVRLVFFLSDGESTDDEEVPSYASMATLVDGGAVLGYGTPEGGRMLKDDGSGYIQDPSTGTDALSVLDETALQTVADQLGIPYVHRTGPDQAQLDGLVGDVQGESELRAEGRQIQIWNPVVWPAALVLTLILLIEGWLLVRGWVPVRRRPVGATAPAASHADTPTVGSESSSADPVVDAVDARAWATGSAPETADTVPSPGEAR
ncbi:VWA domain-containing protein [Cellulomonas sp. NPDC089187]|uniref:VWA domain-containing protein n=1 Tax=Cellulomonas sp. NPDC089187 TaxID=3154970 RepID=UPI00342DAD6B